MKLLSIVCLLIFVPILASGQKQLLLMNRQDVVFRLNPGDEIVFKLKDSKVKRVSYVNNIFDTALVAHKDVIPFHRIERIYFKNKKFYNSLGAALVIAGAGLFLIDQFNVVVVQGQPASLDSWVSTTSIVSVAIGLPMMLIRKKSQRLNGRYRLMMVKEGSPFYFPNGNR